MNGLLSIGSRLAAHFGLSNIWDGEEGLGAVAREKLKEIGVPEHPVPITTHEDLTPRQMAERAGFIKKRKKLAK